MITRIIIMAKAPVAGLAKTRLIPEIGADSAANLAQSMLIKTLTHALDSQATKIELCVSPPINDPMWNTVKLSDAIRKKIEISSQSEGDLGIRMANAVSPHLANGEHVILIGTDCPQLTGIRLSQAAYELVHYDAVIHPASDGGYTLLGLSRFNNTLFENIAWSTDTVARETLLIMKKLKWSVRILDTLHDIDKPSDLVYLNELP